MMRTRNGSALRALIAGAAWLALPALVAAQQGSTGAQPAPQSAPEIMQALMRDLDAVEEKLLALAEAIPEDDYGWRPGEGVRSVSEVLMHIAADNYFLPTVAGTNAPAETGIQASDYESVQAYERRPVSKAEALDAVRSSFAHLETVMQDTDQGVLDSTLNVFGSSMSGLQLWVLTTTHLHEHLGQMIAYARANGVVPPWSQ